MPTERLPDGNVLQKPSQSDAVSNGNIVQYKAIELVYTRWF